MQTQRPLSPALFLLFLLGPGLAFGGLCLFQHLGQRDAGPAARMKAKARMALKNADKTVAECDADKGEVFLSHLYRALTAAIFAAAGRSGEALTWKEAEDLLVQSGLDAEAARHTAGVLADIESAKFSPTGVSPERAGHMLADVRRLVRRLAP